MEDDIVYRLRKRAEIRRDIKTRKSVQEGRPDRIADLLDEAAEEIDALRIRVIRGMLASLMREVDRATITPIVQGDIVE